MTRNRATWSRRRVTHERAHGNLTACGSVGPTVREPGTATCGRCRAIRIKYVSEKGFTDDTINMSPGDLAKIVHDLDEQLFEAMYYPLTSPLNIPVPPSDNRTERMLNRKRKRRATVIDVEAKDKSA